MKAAIVSNGVPDWGNNNGIEDFHIERGDTLRAPVFTRSDQLATFDCVIANPPFSLDKWGDELWMSDRYGRNFAGLPPKTTGDYAWVQHMITSMAAKSGRMAVVVPHGVLFRMGAEGTIRRNILERMSQALRKSSHWTRSSRTIGISTFHAMSKQYRAR